MSTIDKKSTEWFDLRVEESCEIFTNYFLVVGLWSGTIIFPSQQGLKVTVQGL